MWQGGSELGKRSDEAARDSVSGLDQPTERRGARVEAGTS